MSRLGPKLLDRAEEEAPSPHSDRDLEGELLDLRARLELLEEDRNALRLLVQQSRTTAYVSDALPLESFSHPAAGRVIGYRDQHEVVPPEAAYAYFTDVFRGPPERVRTLQRRYLPLLAGHEPVLDVGCGRGELLDLLREAGMSYRGVDADPAMVDRCRQNGHCEVAVAEAIDHLDGLEDAGLGAIVASHVLEHLPQEELTRFLHLARSKLRGEGILIAETVNPYAFPSFRAFWIDPTHVHLLFPETLMALCRVAGFPSACVFHPEACLDAETDRFLTGAYAVLAHAG